VISRSARLAGVVVVFALLAAGCFPNGRYPSSALTAVTPTCQIVNEKVNPLMSMISAAYSAGIQLRPEESSFLPPGVAPPPRIMSCYRDYDMQVWWRDYYCSIGHCGYAAVPGTSKHGTGHAVDFQDQLGELTFSSPGYQWLAANATSFGFMQPPSVQQGGANPEAWHWEAS
jgi:hypothetical protein